MKKSLALSLCFCLLLLSQTSVLAKLAPGDYIDVQKHWARDAIQEASIRGLMQGTGTNAQGFKIFLPDQAATRAEAAAVLTRTFSLDYGSIRFIKQPLVSDYYVDVEDTSWYASAVLLCAINGVLNDDTGYFCPDRPVSRLEMARAIYKCYEAKQVSIPIIQMLPVYEDTGQLDGIDLSALAFVTFTGIMTGDGGYFRPEDKMTRAELAQVVVRCCNILNQHYTIDENYNNQEYRVSCGETFTLSLEGNPTTGYQWILNDNYSQGMLSLVENFYVSSQSEPQAVGQGGRYYWRFKALQAGSTEIKLTYARPWESRVPEQTFTVNIVAVP